MVRYDDVSCLFRPKGRGVMGTYPNNALRANQLDMLVRDASLGVTLAIGLEVAQVTNVALFVLGSTVGLVVGVD
jgi:hypothetical protein